MNTKRKVTLFVDAGHLREILKRSQFDAHHALNIIKVLRATSETGEEIHKILYYDSPPFEGEITRPDGKILTYQKKNNELDELQKKDLVDIRRGVLRFRGWQLRKKSVKKIIQNQKACFDVEDLEPHFEQKCVDVRIGLDIAATVARGKVDRILLITGDLDMLSAIKYARKNEVQVVLFRFLPTPESQRGPIFLHADFIRTLDLKTLELAKHFKE